MFAAGTATAQDDGLTPITAGQEESRVTEGGAVEEAMIAATPDDPAFVPSIDGGLANAGTMSDATLGQPLGGMDIQPQVTTLGQFAYNFNAGLLIVMGIITLFVFALLAWAMLRYRRKDGVAPSKTTHNVFIEVVWTILPVFILVGIAIPSFGLLAAQYDPPEADVTIKATGYQWYWGYEYPDEGGFSFDAIMLSDEEAAAAGEPRLLATDNRVVVPVNATVKVLVTAADVLHSWAMPAFWVKMDAVPGKINETWFRAEETGVFYGQCSELCGTQHGFMPIAVEVVEQDVYDAWVARRQADAGIDPADLVEADEDVMDPEGQLGVAATTAATAEIGDEDGFVEGSETTGMVVEEAGASAPSEVGELVE
jgi:cytochrome c oxidase subunit 2